MIYRHWAVATSPDRSTLHAVCAERETSRLRFDEDGWIPLPQMPLSVALAVMYTGDLIAAVVSAPNGRARLVDHSGRMSEEVASIGAGAAGVRMGERERERVELYAVQHPSTVCRVYTWTADFLREYGVPACSNESLAWIEPDGTPIVDTDPRRQRVVVVDGITLSVPMFAWDGSVVGLADGHVNGQNVGVVVLCRPGQPPQMYPYETQHKATLAVNTAGECWIGLSGPNAPSPRDVMAGLLPYAAPVESLPLPPPLVVPPGPYPVPGPPANVTLGPAPPLPETPASPAPSWKQRVLAWVLKLLTRKAGSGKVDG